MKKPQTKVGSKNSAPETTKPKSGKTAAKNRSSSPKTKTKSKKPTAGKMMGHSVSPGGAPDLNASDYPVHPPRIWPD